MPRKPIRLNEICQGEKHRSSAANNAVFVSNIFWQNKNAMSIDNVPNSTEGNRTANSLSPKMAIEGTQG